MDIYFTIYLVNARTKIHMKQSLNRREFLVKVVLDDIKNILKTSRQNQFIQIFINQLVRSFHGETTLK